MKQQLPNLGIQLNKLQSFILAITFMGVIFLPASVQILGINADNTFLDNRTPHKLPSFPMKVNGLPKFKTELSHFLQDNFGMRAQLLKLNILVNLKIGVSSVPGLILGKNGWLFLKNDHAILDQYRGINRFTLNELKDWVDILSKYDNWMTEKGIYFLVVVVPNQQTVYSEYMPDYANKVNPYSRLDQLTHYLKKTNSKINFLDLRSDLIDAKLRFPKHYLYNKYEGHWNELGAFVAYEVMVNAISNKCGNIAPLSINDFEVQPIKKTWTIPPLTEESIVLADNRLVGRELKSTSNYFERNKKKLDPCKIIFYGDSFGDEALLPLMRKSIPNILNVESNWKPFPVELIDQEKPNIVIFEIAERYLARPFVLNDKLR